MNAVLGVEFLRSSDLHKAVWHNKKDEVIELLNKGVSVNLTDAVGNTPLHTAAHRGYAKIAKILLTLGKAPANSRNIDGWTPMHFASRIGHDSVVRVLISKGAHADDRDLQQYTPLCIAAREGHLSTVELLLRRGATIDPRTISGVSPLLLACSNNRKDVALKLASVGALLHKRSTYHHTPLEAAMEQGWGEDLIRSACKPSAPDTSYFIRSDNNSITFQWNVPEKSSENTSIHYTGFKSNSSTIDFYELSRRELPHGEWETFEHHFQENPAKPGMPVTYRVYNCLPGTCYEIRVRAHTSLGFGPWSKSSEKMRTKTTPPSAVCEPLFVTSNHDSVTIEFEPPRDNGSKIDLYQVARKESSEWGHWGDIFTFDAGSDMVNCEGLDSCSSYRFRMRAHNESGWGEWSVESNSMSTTGLLQKWNRQLEDINEILALGHERMARDSFNQWIVYAHTKGWLMDVDIVSGMPCRPQLEHHMAMVSQRVEGRGRRQVTTEWSKAQIKKRALSGSLLEKVEEFKKNKQDTDGEGHTPRFVHHLSFEGEPTLVPFIYRSTPQPKKEKLLLLPITK